MQSQRQARPLLVAVTALLVLCAAHSCAVGAVRLSVLAALPQALACCTLLRSTAMVQSVVAAPDASCWPVRALPLQVLLVMCSDW